MMVLVRVFHNLVHILEVNWITLSGTGPYAGFASVMECFTGTSNCDVCQADAATRAGCHGCMSRIMALSMMSSFRMQAVSATFSGLPAAISRT